MRDRTASGSLVVDGELSSACSGLVGAMMELTGSTVCVIDPDEYLILRSNLAEDERPVNRRKCHDVFHGSPVPCWLDGTRCPLQLLKSGEGSIVVNHMHVSGAGSLEMMEVETIPVRNERGELELAVQRCSPLEDGTAAGESDVPAELIMGSGLRVLSGLSMRLLESMSLGDALAGAAEEIRKTLSVGRAYIGRLAGDFGKPEDPSAGGAPLRALPPFILGQLDRGEGYFGNTCDLPPSDSRALMRRGVTSLAVLPIMVDTGLWGYLGVETTGRPRSWNGSESRILLAASRMLASAIEKWKALEELKSSLEKIGQAFTGISEALSFAVEKRDPYTAGHQKRVVRIATSIGEMLGLRRENMECLQVASLLHDVGKIRIPGDILSRPGELSELERSFIRNHPQEGYEILSAVNFPWPVAEVVLEHHERYDGSGYPRGLKGEEIMPEARILGLADVAEAMTSHRPYRPALSEDEMEDEIRSNRGSLYDPDAVDAFLSILIEGEGLAV